MARGQRRPSPMARPELVGGEAAAGRRRTSSAMAPAAAAVNRAPARQADVGARTSAPATGATATAPTTAAAAAVGTATATATATPPAGTIAIRQARPDGGTT